MNNFLIASFKTPNTNPLHFNSLVNGQTTEISLIQYSDYKNIVSVKNEAIEIAIKQNKKYVFLIEDSIIVTNNNVYNNYIEFMQKTDLPVMSYQYANGNNKILGNIPNGGAIIKSDMGDFHLSKYWVNSFIVIDVEKIGSERFDENLQVLVGEEFVDRLFKQGKIAFSGLYFDIEDSYKYLTDNVAFIHPNTLQEKYKSDEQYLMSKQIKFQFERNLDSVVTWIKTLQLLNS